MYSHNVMKINSREHKIKSIERRKSEEKKKEKRTHDKVSINSKIYREN